MAVDMKESFDTLVSKLEKQGKSEHYAKAIAGKVAKEKGDMPYQKKEASESEDCPYAKLGKLTERVLSGKGNRTGGHCG